MNEKIVTIDYFPGFQKKLKSLYHHVLVMKPPPKIHEIVCMISINQKSGVYEISYKTTNGSTEYFHDHEKILNKTKKKHIADIKFGRLSTAL